MRILEEGYSVMPFGDLDSGQAISLPTIQVLRMTLSIPAAQTVISCLFRPLGVFGPFFNLLIVIYVFCGHLHAAANAACHLHAHLYLQIDETCDDGAGVFDVLCF